MEHAKEIAHFSTTWAYLPIEVNIMPKNYTLAKALTHRGERETCQIFV